MVLFYRSHIYNGELIGLKKMKKKECAISRKAAWRFRQTKLSDYLHQPMAFHHYTPFSQLSISPSSQKKANFLTLATAFIARRLHLLYHSRTNWTNGHLDATPFTPLTCANSSSFSTGPVENTHMIIIIIPLWMPCFAIAGKVA